jgi:hypothetical protein
MPHKVMVPSASGVLPSVPDTIHELSTAVTKAAKTYVFPMALTLIVVLFLLVQSRLDRRDPKLSMAPVDSKLDEMDFE